VAVLPALQQRTRQQRQPPGLLGDLVDHGLGQPRLQLQPGPTGGQLDRPAQLAGVHRADQDVVGGQEAGQGGVGGAVAVVVGPHRDHHGHRVVGLGGLDQGGQESGPLVLVVADGEGLFELIDDQQHALLPGDRSQQRYATVRSRQGEVVARSALAAGTALVGVGRCAGAVAYLGELP
jgi:hypothetical protein